jgi:hypothetical protein
MRKNTFFVAGMLVCLLVFGLTVVGCNNGTTEEPDTWSNVTNLAQVNGTWKGSESLTEREEGITITAVYELTTTINANTKTQTGTVKITVSFSGEGIDLLWGSIKTDDEFEDATFDDAKHSATMIEDIGSRSITLDDMDGVQINQNGTKVKIPAGAMGEGAPEMILNKQ